MRTTYAGGRLQRVAAILCFLAAASGAGAAMRQPGDPQGPHLLVDAASGEVLRHFDAERPWYPASTTKLMTLYVTLRAVEAREIAPASPVTISGYAAAQPSSKMGFNPGAELTLDDALKIMMVTSANDIAVAVAESVGGSVDDFAARMNREAERLGMTRSHFVNPHGLPDERQVTTARDMAVLARALLADFPEHREYLKVHAIQLGGEVLENFNPLLERYPGATGMKTGFICASGYNLVASARRGERELIAVVFGAYGGMQRAEFAVELLDEGFASAGMPSVAPLTLAGMSAGQTQEKALDMRPFVCSPERAAAASEANTEGGEAEISRLTVPIYLGPPEEVFVNDPNARPGELGFAPRVPRPRPSGTELADAFAPVAPGVGDGRPSSEAIGDSLGAPLALEALEPE